MNARAPFLMALMGALLGTVRAHADAGFGACCSPDGSCVETSEFLCNLNGGTFQSGIILCTQVVCDGACCQLDGTCARTGPGNCNGTYQGIDTDCADAVCGGACCAPDGGCALTGPTTCNGSFEGLGTECGNVDCTGACCLRGGGCAALGAGDCDGMFHGLGTPCANASCPFGACCLPQKECAELTDFECDEIDGAFQGDGSLCGVDCPQPISAAFTYQGQLKDGALPVTDLVDMEFSLWISPDGDQMVGSTIRVDDISVVNGLFQIELDFGHEAFNGNARWLEVAVCPSCNEAGAGFTVLSPRQPLTAAPYALQTRGIVVNAAADVGIGTKTPLAPLHVVAPAADSSVMLPDSTISAAEVLDEPGIAVAVREGTLNSLTIDTSPTTILQRDITVPADGHVVAVATIEVFHSHTLGTVDSAVFWILDSPTRPLLLLEYAHRVPAALPTSTDYGFSKTIHARFTVTAGTHTFFAMGEATESTSEFRASDAIMTLMYFPTDYQPTGRSAASGSAGKALIPGATADQYRERLFVGSADLERHHDLRRTSSYQQDLNAVQEELAQLRQRIRELESR